MVIGSYSLNRLIEPFSNLLLSLIVIRKSSVELWGELVIVMLIVRLAYQFLSWGHRDYLLKTMSRSPERSQKTWLSNLIFRSLLMPICIVAIWFLSPLSNQMAFWAILWLIATFLHKAWDVIILYEKRFLPSSLIEIISFLSVFLFLQFYIDHLSVVFLVKILALTVFSKATILALIFRVYFYNGIDLGEWRQRFKNSLGYFLPTIVGFVQSRLDLYFVALMMPAQVLGQYQILLSFIVMIQNFISFAVSPYVKIIYRLRDKTINKLNKLVSIYGFLGSVMGILIIYWIINFYYVFDFNYQIYLLSFLQLIPFALFQVKIHQLFKYNRQYWIVYTSCLAAITNAGLNLWLIPIYDISGALVATAISQWVVWFSLKFSVRLLQQKSKNVEFYAG